MHTGGVMLKSCVTEKELKIVKGAGPGIVHAHFLARKVADARDARSLPGYQLGRRPIKRGYF